MRPWLRRISVPWVAVVSFTLVLAMTTLCTEVAVGLLDDPGRSWLRAAREEGLTLGRNLAIAGIVAVAVLRYLYVQQQWKRRLQSEAQARIQALQARIRPHFLFNSLNTIASLTRTDAAQAEGALEDLSDLFRASLQESNTEISLGEELDLCRRYLGLEQLRLGERLQVRWAVAALPAKALVPALSLQPLVENAVYHGVQPNPEGGRVSVSGICEQGRIAVLIRNPLPPEGARQHREGNRLAQDNVRQRLQALYGGSAQLEVRRDAGWYEVRVAWPLRLAD
jgi:two-component system sensor histidine kinase AlgZ